MQKELKMEDIKAKTIKYVLSLPPYQYSVLHANHMSNTYITTKYSGDEVNRIKNVCNLISEDLNKDINDMLRLVEVEKDLIKLIETTDNKIFYRKLFFPTIFVNNDFKFDNWIIKGILVRECICSFGEASRLTDKDAKANDYVISVTAIDPYINEFWNLVFFLVDKTPHKRDNDFDPRAIQEYIRNIICNIVDTVEGNDEDLNIVTIETTKEQNAKRIKKGKVSFPTKIYIKARGDFKNYIQKFNTTYEDNDKRKIGHRFLVRGHWMNFRSERYVNKKGERKWIKPFWKGEGIVLSKDYKLA